MVSFWPEQLISDEIVCFNQSQVVLFRLSVARNMFLLTTTATYSNQLLINLSSIEHFQFLTVFPPISIVIQALRAKNWKAMEALGAAEQKLQSKLVSRILQCRCRHVADSIGYNDTNYNDGSSSITLF